MSTGARQPLRERHAEHPELLLAPPDAEAEREPAAGELIDDGRVLGEPERVVERGQHHAGPQADAVVASANAPSITRSDGR